MVIVHPIPLNAIAWSLGVPGGAIFTYKTARIYVNQRNPLAGLYSIVFGLLMLSFCFFGFPGWFTHDTKALTLAYYFADFFLLASFIAQAYLLWFVGLKTRINKWAILGPTILLITTIFVLDLMGSRSFYQPNLILNVDPTLSLGLKTILYLIIPWPLAYFIIRIGTQQTSAAAQAKSIIIGLAYFALSTGSVFSNIFDNGADTISSSSINIVCFIIFFIITAWPRSAHALIKC